MEPFLHSLVSLSLALLASLALGSLAARVGVPRVTAYLLVGLALGPQVLLRLFDADGAAGRLLLGPATEAPLKVVSQLAVGFILFVGWVFDAASGPEVYAMFLGAVDTTFGRILLVGWSWAFFYHLANGIRHLVWDTGRGFEKEQATASAWFVIVASVVLTALFWWVAT